MSNEVGGRNDKLGNRYERNCIIKAILEVVEEKTKSCLFEGLGQDEIATDILVNNNDGTKKYIQCKQRNLSNDDWSFGDFNKYKLLQKWKIHLDANEKNCVALQTPITFNSLADLCRRAKDNDGDPDKFLENQIKTSEGTFSDYKKYCKYLDLNYEVINDVRISMGYLSRTTIEQIPDEMLREIILIYIKKLFIGNEEEIYCKFVDLVCNEEIMGKEIDNKFLYNFFDKEGIVINDLSNDKINFPVLKTLNEEFKNSLTLINDSYIEREELNEIVNNTLDCNSTLILGKAGYGKSGIMYGLTNYFKENHITYLAIKLDRKTPKNNVVDWSKSLGFTMSLVYCLDKFSKDENCVLILDQLDALRWTSVHSRDAMDICSSLIDEVSKINLTRNKKISVIMACRTFDYENDVNINKLIDSKKINDNLWKKIKLETLKDADVEKVVGKNYSRYNSKVKNMLKIPSNLFLWKKANINDEYDSISSIKDLINRWWDDISFESLKIGLDSKELLTARNTIVDKMKKYNMLSINRVLINNIDSNIISYLCSKEFFIENNNILSFSHQSIFDYYCVEKMINSYFSGESIEKLIGEKDNQVPSVRYQLQMFLEILCEIDQNKFIEAIDIILNSNKIRAYIKYTAFEVLGLVQNVSNNLEKYILENYLKDEFVEDYFNTVFMNHENMIALLVKNGVFDKWISEQKTTFIVSLFKSIDMNLQNDEVDFIKKYLFKEEQLDRELYKCFPLEMYYDTDELFELRLNIYEKYDDLLERCYLNLDELIKYNEIRAIKIVELLGRKLPLSKKHIKYENSIIEYEENMKIKGDAFVLKTLLPLLPLETNEYNVYDWKKEKYNEKNIQRIIISLLKMATVNLIKEDYKKFYDIFSPYLNKGFIVHNELILFGLLNLPDEESNKILKYLFTNIDNNCFEFTSGSSQSISFLKKIIIKFIDKCDNTTLNIIETNLLNYKQNNMVEQYKYYMSVKKENFTACMYLSYWGDFQHEILNIIPIGKMSKKAEDLRQVLNRKYNYKISPKFNNHFFESGSVVSPIAQKELSDKSWLKILSNKKIINNRKTKFYEKNSTFVESSLYEFQSTLSFNIKKEPIRFIELFINNTNYILKEYIITLYSSIACSEQLECVSNELLEKLFLTIDYRNDNYELAPYICEIISRKQNTDWSKEIIYLLIQIYEDIKRGLIQKNYFKHDDERDIALEYELIAINSTIGKFSEAVAKLLWDNSVNYEMFKEIINEMCISEDEYVRFSVMFMLHPILKYDLNYATERILKLFENNEIYYFRNNRNILYCTYDKCESLREKITKIVLSGLKSTSKNSKVIFSTLIVDMFLAYNEFQDYINIIQDDIVKNQIMEMFIEYLNTEEYKEQCKTEIVKLLSLDNIKVNPYRLFNNQRINLDDDCDFILAIFESKKSQDLVEPFIYWIKKEGVNLNMYDEIIFKITKEAIEQYDKNNPEHNYAYDDLNYIIIRLFDEVSNTNLEHVKIMCLDLWDEMFIKHIGSIRKLSREIVNL